MSIVSFGFVLLSIGIVFQLSTADPTCLSRIEIEKSLKDVHIPGAAIVVVNSGHILYERAVGHRSLSPLRPMSVDNSIFILASISKTFIGVAGMQLVEENRLDLDQDINTYLSSDKRRFFHPQFPSDAITPTDASATRITLEGLCYNYLTSNTSNWLPRRPGTVTQYSNVGTTLAALVIEKISKTPYESYITEKILKPLGISPSDASFRLADIKDNDRLVQHYAFNGSLFDLWKQELPQLNLTRMIDQPDWIAIPQFSMTIYPAGLLRMSAKSLSVFLQMFMRYGSPLLSRSSVVEMRKLVSGVVPYRDASGNDDPWRVQSLGYGVAWNWKKTTDGRRFIGHGGTIFGLDHSMLVNEESTIGIVFLTMGDVLSDDELRKKMADRLGYIRRSLFQCFDPHFSSSDVRDCVFL